MYFKMGRVSVLGYKGINLHQVVEAGVDCDAIFRAIGWNQKYVDSVNDALILVAISRELTELLNGKSCVFLDMVNKRLDDLSLEAVKKAKTMREISDADDLVRSQSEIKEYAQLKRKDITLNEVELVLLRYYHLTQGPFDKYYPLLLQQLGTKETLEETRQRTIQEYKKHYREILKFVVHGSGAEHLAVQGLLQCQNITFGDLEIISRGIYSDLIWDQVGKKKEELKLERDKRVEICQKAVPGSKKEKEAVLRLIELY